MFGSDGMELSGNVPLHIKVCNSLRMSWWWNFYNLRGLGGGCKCIPPPALSGRAAAGPSPLHFEDFSVCPFCPCTDNSTHPQFRFVFGLQRWWFVLQQQQAHSTSLWRLLRFKQLLLALAQTRRPPLSAQVNDGFDAYHAVTDHRILMILRELMTLMSKHVFQPSLLLSGDLRWW